MISGNMSRLLKPAALVLGLLLLASCPNPDGSGDTLKTVTVKPVLDGYVDDAPAEDFDSGLVYVNEDIVSGDDSVVLVKFDSADLPLGKTVIAASLKVRCVTGPDSLDTITAYRIKQLWDEGTIDHAAAGLPAFLDEDTPSKDRDVTSQDSGEDLTWSIREIVQEWVEGRLNYGLILKSTSADPGGQTVLSAKEGEKSPQLEIWYK